MNREEVNNLLAKWLDGSIAPADLRELEKEVDLKTLHATLEQQKHFELEHHPVADMWKEFEDRIQQAPKEKTPPGNRRWWLLVVVIGIIGLVIYFLSQTSQQFIKTVPEERQELIIADGTKVLIGPGSVLEFDSSQWANQRAMQLNGQAIFEVSKGSPFSVQTRQGKVEVLGTRFDVWAMGSQMRVQCFEGRVSVSTSTNKDPVILNIGQEVYVNNMQLESVENFIAEDADWLLRERLFKKTPLSIVIQDIERFFAVQIEVGTLPIDSNFSGRIPVSDLDKALDYLCRTMNWKYEKSNTKILLSPQ